MCFRNDGVRPIADTYHIQTGVIMKRTLMFLAATIFSFSALSAAKNDWPLEFTNISIGPAAYKRVAREIPSDCQPEHFDPSKTKLRLDKSSGFYGLTGAEADESVSVQIDGWAKPGDSRIALPKPFSLTKYAFECASTSSQVFMFKKKGKRHALYTHIEMALFSPDLSKLVMFNYLKIAEREWREQRRIIDYRTKKYSYLPVIDETTHVADVTNVSIVTYGMATKPASDYKNRRRVVGIWSHDGKLIRALYAPLQDTAANAYNSDDGIGLLPEEPSTFYHLTRTGKNICTLRLQDIALQEKQRAIQLNVPGPEWDPVAVGMRVQIELTGLKLNGGSMKYRISPSGRGDVSGDWGPWQVAR